MTASTRRKPGKADEAARHLELLGRARVLMPVLRERAGEAEELRRLPPDSERDLHETGLYRMLQPQRVGGAELDYGALIDIGAELARGCAATAWNLTNLSSHHWMLAMFPPAAQERVWGENPDALIASSFIFPAGKVTRAKGGYIVSGRWPFSSGVDPSDWNMLAGMAPAQEDGGAPDPRVFLLHKSDYQIIDTWHVTGLKGTGSKDVACEEVFVPEEMSVSARDVKGGPTPGSALNPAPLYKLPVFALFPFILSGVALGNAEGCCELYLEGARQRASKYNGAKLAELQGIQIRIGTAAANCAIARRTMLGICADAMTNAIAGAVPDLETKMAYRRDAAVVTKLCTDAVDMLAEASGAQALYLTNPTQRIFRDAHAIAAHIAFSIDAAASAHGRVALGLDADHPTI